MVQRRTVRKKLSKIESKKSAQKDVSDVGGVDTEVQTDSLSTLRQKRKVTKKLKFLTKLKETQQILSVKKSISKKKHGHKRSALNTLYALADVLPLLQQETKPDKEIKLSKRKHHQELVVHEAKQLSKVLEHPEFKSNPFSAIHQHLVNTLNPQIEDSERLNKKKNNNKRKDNKQKRKSTKKNDKMEE